ncbi:MAG: hypothetical protein EA350_11470 [Gemmatimonadales bacterium]|nr:MAG: hypothetical protein EA350_11470 [Gemmatimonadales bacterium]
MSLGTGPQTFLYVWESPGGRAALPFSVRSFQGAEDLYTPYGFGGFVGEGDCSGVPSDWRSFAEGNGFVAGFLGINPVVGRPNSFPSGERFAYNHVYLLDLARSEDEACRDLSESRRQQVRAFRKREGLLVDDRLRCAEFLLTRTGEFLDGKGASRVPFRNRTTLEALVALPNVLLLGAGSSSELQAVSMFTFTEHVAEYFLSVSVPEGRQYSTALVWEGSRILGRLGIPWLNLGGGIVPGDGVARFKERFGGETRPLECLKQVYDPERYGDLCAAAGCDAGSFDGFFPPYHRETASPLDPSSSDSGPS